MIFRALGSLFLLATNLAFPGSGRAEQILIKTTRLLDVRTGSALSDRAILIGPSSAEGQSAEFIISNL